MSVARCRVPVPLFAALLATALGCASEERSHEGHDHAHGAETESAAEHEREPRGGEPRKGGGEHHDEEGEVVLSDVALKQNGVRVEAAPAGALGGGLDVPAQVVPNPTRVVHVTVPVPGKVTAVDVVLGDVIAKGARLATLESAEAGEAQSAIAQARADVEVARKDQERQRELVDSGIGARRNLEEAEAALKRAEAALAAAVQKSRVYGGAETLGSTVVLKSPLAGRVIEHHGNVGEVVGADEAMFIVADLSRVWIEGKVFEQDVGKVHVGAVATLMLQAYPGEAWEGRLTFVGPVVDEKSRAVPVRMELDNEDGRLKPGLFGTLSISPPDGSATEARALLPEDAVQRTEHGAVVFVPGDEKGAFRPVAVAVGARKGGRVEIVSGVRPGDPVVVSGAFVLKSELLKAQLGDGHAH